MPRKLTVGQKRQQRQAEFVNTPVVRTGDRQGNALEKVRRLLGSDGYVFLASELLTVGHRARRSSGIPSLDYLLGGGLPMGGQIELGAPYSTGKSTLAIKACSVAQRKEPGKLIMWVPIEPWSAKWMRTVGLWIPFNETLVVNPSTGEEEPADPFSLASPTELFRMQELGIEDPYSTPDNLARVVVMAAEYGDATLAAVVEASKTNEFSIIVVDSLGMAKAEKWTSEQDTRDAADYDRTPKMIGDYTARIQLSHNTRYDDNNEKVPGGRHQNQTTVINLQQISTNMNNQSFSPWAAFTIKGGEGSKHNHLSINALLQGAPVYYPESGDKKERVGHIIKMKNLKSKIGSPYRDSEITFYTADTPDWRAGDFDVWADALKLGVMSGVVIKSGNWHCVGDVQLGNGKDAAAQFLRDNSEWYDYVASASVQELCK